MHDVTCMLQWSQPSEHRPVPEALKRNEDSFSLHTYSRTIFLISIHGQRQFFSLWGELTYSYYSCFLNIVFRFYKTVSWRYYCHWTKISLSTTLVYWAPWRNPWGIPSSLAVVTILRQWVSRSHVFLLPDSNTTPKFRSPWRQKKNLKIRNTLFSNGKRHMQ
jgi:hypothetical protein